jgi:hypothetical protein
VPCDLAKNLATTEFSKSTEYPHKRLYWSIKPTRDFFFRNDLMGLLWIIKLTLTFRKKSDNPQPFLDGFVFFAPDYLYGLRPVFYSIFLTKPVLRRSSKFTFEMYTKMSRRGGSIKCINLRRLWGNRRKLCTTPTGISRQRRGLRD